MMKKFYGIVVLMLIVQISFAQKLSDPQLIAPENEMVNVMPNTTLDWSAVSGVGEITYHLQVATDAAFSDLIVDADGIDITAYYNENLIFGLEYFWRVKAIEVNEDGTDESNWSETFSYTVFSTVELKNPDDDEEALRPTFQWEEEIDDVVITGVDHFKIEIDTTEDFNSPLLISEVVPAEIDKYYEYISDYLQFGTVYFWKVKPYSLTSEGEYDEVFEFETLFTVELDEPGNGDDEIEFDILFEWTDLVENDEEPYIDLFDYTMELSTDEAFTNPITYVVDSNTITSNILKFGTEYFWRVKASHVNGSSIWSEVFDFTTVEEVVLDAPDDGSFLVDPRPTLEWEALAEVDGYQIVLSTNADLSDPTYYLVENANTEKYPLTELDAGYDYYWSVRSFNGTDTTVWAEPFTFYVSADGVNSLSHINNMSLYPSPATDNVTMAFNVKQSTEITWIITDVLGQSITEETLQVSTGLFTKSINIADLNNGIYFLEIRQGEEKSAMKFVVE